MFIPVAHAGLFHEEGGEGEKKKNTVSHYRLFQNFFFVRG